MYCGFAFSVACRDTLILPGSLLPVYPERRVDSILLSGYTGRRRRVKHTERGKQP